MKTELQPVEKETIEDPSQAKLTPSYCILTLPLAVRPFQAHAIDKRLETARQLYNSLLSTEMSKYRRITHTPEYLVISKGIYALLDEYYVDPPLTEEDIKAGKKRKIDPQYKTDVRYKDLLKQRNQYYRDNGFHGSYSFQPDLAPLKNYYETIFKDGKIKKNPQIGAQVCNELAIRLWQSFEKFLYKGSAVRYIRKGELNTLESSNKQTPMVVKDGVFYWHGLACPLKMSAGNMYEAEMLTKEICYYRLVRKFVRGENKYYVQIILKGTPVAKRNKETGSFMHQTSLERVGLDIGLQVLAAVSKDQVRLIELADRCGSLDTKLEAKMQFIDRSRRATSPWRFNPDGTIRRQRSGTKENWRWFLSHAYFDTKGDIKEIHRFSADVRKMQHNVLANEVLEIGSDIIIENINFSGLSKRAQETVTREDGSIESKKRGGKSISTKAPAMFVSILENKCKAATGHALNKVDTKTIKASDYDHTTGKYQKRESLSRWVYLANGDKVHRNLYCAFLLFCVADGCIDQKQCDIMYPSFKHMHDQELVRLKGKNDSLFFEP